MIVWNENLQRLEYGEAHLYPTHCERQLLTVLCKKPGAVVTHRAVQEVGVFDTASSVKRLRAKMRGAFGNDLALVTMAGQGFRWNGGIKRAIEFKPVELAGADREPHDAIVKKLQDRKFARIGYGQVGGEILETWADANGRFAVCLVDATGFSRLIAAGVNWVNSLEAKR